MRCCRKGGVLREPVEGLAYGLPGGATFFASCFARAAQDRSLGMTREREGCEGGSEVYRGGGLTDAAFLVEDRDDCCHGCGPSGPP